MERDGVKEEVLLDLANKLPKNPESRNKLFAALGTAS